MPKPVYGDPLDVANPTNLELPSLKDLAAPFIKYNNRITDIMSQLESARIKEDKERIMERLRLLKDEMALAAGKKPLTQTSSTG